MVKFYNEKTTQPSMSVPLKLALQDLSNKLGREIFFKWKKLGGFDNVDGIKIDDVDELIIEGQRIVFKITEMSQEEIFNILYDRIKNTKDTWDEMLFENENEQAFYDAARDLEYIV